MSTYSAGSASVQIVPDFSGAQRAIGRWFASQGDLKVKVDPDLDNSDLAAMRARVQAQRPELHVSVDRKHLAKELVTAIDFVTGTSLVGGALRKLFDVKPILMTSLAGAGTAIAGELTKGAAGLAAFAPALTSALAIPIGTAVLGSQGIVDAFKNIGAGGDPEKLAAALKDLAPSAREFVTEVHSLAPAFKDLRLDVQQQLFEGLGDSVRNLGEKMLPMLRGHLTGVAEEIGFIGKSLVEAMSTDSNIADFATTIDNIKAALHEAGIAVKPLFLAFADMATVGSQFLPGLVKGFGDMAQRFADFIQKARDSGELAAFMQKAIDTTKTLLSILGNVGSALVSIFRAAAPFGQALLGTLKALTGDLATFMKTAEAQTGLHDFFEGIYKAVSTLAPGLLTLAEAMITSVLPAMSAFASAVAPVVNSLLGQFAGLLEDLAPLFYPALAEAVGSALSALAPLVEVFSEIAKKVLPVLTDAIKRLAPLFSELAENIGDALVEAVDAVAPLLPSLVDAIEAIAQALVPFIRTVFNLAVDILPPLVAVLKGVAEALEFIAPILPAVLTGFIAFKAIGGITTLLSGFSAALTGLAQNLAFASYSGIPLLGSVAGSASTAVGGLAGGVGAAGTALGAIAAPLGAAVGLFMLIKSNGDKAAQAALDLAEGMAKLKLAGTIGDPKALAELQDYQDEILGVKDRIAELEEAIADPDSLTVDVDSEELIRLRDELVQLEQGSADADASFVALREELGELGFAQAQAAAAAEVYNREVREHGEGSDEAARAAGYLARAQEDVAAITERTNEATKTQLQLMQEARDKILEAADAQLAYENSQARLKESIDQYNASLTDSTLSEEEHAQSSRDMRQAALDAASAAALKAEKDNEGKTATEIAKAADDARLQSLKDTASHLTGPAHDAIMGIIADLEANATAAAVTRTKFEELGLTVLEVPNEKMIVISAPTDVQIQNLKDLGYAVETLPDGNIIVSADTNPAREEINALVREKYSMQLSVYTVEEIAGGYAGEIGGIVKPMARGGLHTRLTPMSGGIAQVIPPNTWRVIGDRIKDDEAFIPINQSARSQQILGQTADAMGFTLLPNARGGYWLPPGMSSLSGVGQSDVASVASARDLALRGGRTSTADMAMAPTSVAGFVNHGTVLTADLDELSRQTRRGTKKALAVSGL